jgi:hypothetical protein
MSIRSGVIEGKTYMARERLVRVASAWPADGGRTDEQYAAIRNALKEYRALRRQCPRPVSAALRIPRKGEYR